MTTTTATELNIFDHYGNVRDLSGKADRAIIERLDPTTQAVLIDTLKHVTAATDREERIRLARDDVKAKQETYNAAHEADKKANPPATHKSELLRSIAANAGGKVEPIKIDTEARAVFDKALVALAASEAELNRASEGLTALQRASSAAIDRWRNCLTTPTPEANARDYQARSQKDRAERRAKTGSAEPAKVIPAHQWPLDAELLARGKTKVNRRPTYFGR
jgi:hypothetical protein